MWLGKNHPVSREQQFFTPEVSAEAVSILMLGVPFDKITAEAALRRIERMIESKRPHYVVTANVDFLVQARRDVELRRILLEAHLVLCDGTPLVWASRLLGNPLPERVAGADLVPSLIRVAAEKGHRIFFLGGAPGVAEQAAANLQARYPTLNLVGHYSPPFRELLEMDHDEMVRRVRAARPDLLFVSFGCPKAEKWIEMHYRSLGVPVVMGVGATIDFLAGRVRRAPVWMQRAGVEWIFRLLQEPGRLFRRYAADLWHFSRALLAQWWRMQLRWERTQDKPGCCVVMVEPAWQRVQAPQRLDAESIRHDSEMWERISAGKRHCLLELADVEFIDSTGIGLLVRLQKRMRASGWHLILLAPGVAVQRALALMQLTEFFEIAADAIEAREWIRLRERERSRLVTNGARRPLVWQGEITAANAEEIWRQTRTEINLMSSWRKQWVIDLSPVRFIDSTGVSVMIRAKKYAPSRGAKIRFAGASPAVRNVLRAARLESFLDDGL